MVAARLGPHALPQSVSQDIAGANTRVFYQLPSPNECKQTKTLKRPRESKEIISLSSIFPSKEQYRKFVYSVSDDCPRWEKDTLPFMIQHQFLCDSGLLVTS